MHVEFHDSIRPLIDVDIRVIAAHHRDWRVVHISTRIVRKVAHFNQPSALHYSGSAKLITLILMPGEIGEWHENPMPQWIIPLRGRWRVETMDGVIVDMGPGDISFGGDQGTNNRKGHHPIL